MNEKRYRIVIEAEPGDPLPTRQEAWHIILEGYACVSGTPRRERSRRETKPSYYALTVTAPPVDVGAWAEAIDMILSEDYDLPLCIITVE